VGTYRDEGDNVTEASEKTLETLVRLLEGGVTTPHKALVAAFSLGRLEGLAEMASVGRKTIEDLSTIKEQIRASRIEDGRL
jgi:hypothetical protein